MSEYFSRELVKVATAKVLQTIGWNSIQTTPLEILTDILTQHLRQIGRYTNEFANEFGCVEPNLDHLGLAFRELHVNLADLQEYVTYVDFVDPPTPVPKFPLLKENHLNFLKPGSKEVVTRPVHIHEHLPPMHTVLEATENEVKVKIEELENEINGDTASTVFKRPAEISPGEAFKRPRLLMEDEGRPTREISSVMMTTSGFLSPAREGKLPESRTPLAPIEPILSSNSVLPQEDLNRKPKKIERKKEKIGKELFKPIMDDRPRKTSTMKDATKGKQMKVGANAHSGLPGNNLLFGNDVKISPIQNSRIGQPVKFNKALAAARLKTEKFNTTITPIPTKVPPAQQVPIIIPEPPVDKLFTEPDKKKINIFKKISNVKNEKLENKIMKIKDEIKQESRESSPDLIIDESAEMTTKIQHLSNDITIELIDSGPKSPDKVEKIYFDDDSPPGTPSTPKTPEMLSQSPPLTKEKRKRKDKSKIKKVQKQSPVRLDSDVIEIDLERPKTPEAQVILKQEKQETQLLTPTMPFPFFPTFAGPGLIPPIFPNLPIPPIRFPGFMPPVNSGLQMGFMPTPKHEELLSPKLAPVEKIPVSATSPLEREIPSPKSDKKSKEHKKDKKEKIKKKNKKDKMKNKAEKKKLKEEKKDKGKIKKEKREKRKEKEQRDTEVAVPKLTLKIGSGSPRPETPDQRKLNIKPIVKREEEERSISRVEIKREMSPELAKISALVTGQPKPKSISTTPKEETVKEDVATVPVVQPSRMGPGPGRPRIHPIKSKPKTNKQQPATTLKDSEGNEVWICPACGRQDDGSPMIGCDDCDAWYHWVCVGIQVPPDDSENWYCRFCISKKQEVLQTDKKKKRKKRDKKEH